MVNLNLSRDPWKTAYFSLTASLLTIDLIPLTMQTHIAQ